MSDQFPDGFAANRAPCLACHGVDDDPDFDYCRACGRVGQPLPYGSGAPLNAAAIAEAPKTEESPLRRAIRMARGELDIADAPALFEGLRDVLAKTAKAEVDDQSASAASDAPQVDRASSRETDKSSTPDHQRGGTK